MRVVVTGHNGFVGQAVCRRLIARGHEIPDSNTYVYVGEQFVEWLQAVKPDAVIHLAKPKSDGIGTMAKEPFTFAAGVIGLDLQVIRACAVTKPQPKLVCLGSVCAYPEKPPTRPVTERSLWSGYPEAVNAPYGIAKRTQLMLLQAARQETGLNGIHLVMANVYGPGDRSSHVIPATIRKMRDPGVQKIVVWGLPTVTRAFLYVEDAAEGIIRAMERYDSPEPLNLAPRDQTSMDRLCTDLRHLTDFRGEISYDMTKPTGQKQRWYDITRLSAALDWQPSTSLWDGLRATVEWMKETEKEESAK